MKKILIFIVMVFWTLFSTRAQKITVQTQVKLEESCAVSSSLNVKNEFMTFAGTLSISKKPAFKTLFLQVTPCKNLNVCLGNFTFGGFFPQIKKTAFSSTTVFSSVMSVSSNVRANVPGISTSENTPYSFLLSDTFSFPNFDLHFFTGTQTEISNANIKETPDLTANLKKHSGFFSGCGIQFSKINLVITGIGGSHFVTPKSYSNWFRNTRNFVPQRIAYNALGATYKNDFCLFSTLSEISASPYGKPTFSTRNELLLCYRSFSWNNGFYVSSLDHLIPAGSMNRKVFSAYTNPLAEIQFPLGINVEAGCRYTVNRSYNLSRNAKKTDRADLVFEETTKKDGFALSVKLAVKEAEFGGKNPLLITEDSLFTQEISLSLDNKFGKFFQNYAFSVSVTSFPDMVGKEPELELYGSWTAKIDKLLTLYCTGKVDYIKKKKYLCDGFSMKQKAVFSLFDGKTTFTLQASGSKKFAQKKDSVLEFFCNAKIML